MIEHLIGATMTDSKLAPHLNDRTSSARCMAPQRFAGSAGLRVLLAGSTPDDLQAARDFLQGEGALGAYDLVGSQE